MALLFGGRSGEHEVSLRSGLAVAEGLRARHDVSAVLVDRAGRWLYQGDAGPRAAGGEPVFLAPVPEDRGVLRRLSDAAPLARPDVYFPVLHGPFGEDGTLQGLLELAAVPFVGAGVAASATGMDKELMKALFAQAGLPQVPWRALRSRESDAARLIEEFGLPLFVKPANLGSSVAVSRVARPEELPAALDLAFAWDRKVIVERAVNAREIEVAVLGNDEPEASVPGEIVPDRAFYDYDSKYAADSKTELRIPAPLPDAQRRQLQELARRAFLAIDAAGFARVDFFVERDTGALLLNEINTIPGFTSISMFPKLWEASGLDYASLLERLVTLAFARHARRAALRANLS